jgi:hypothetical protein
MRGWVLALNNALKTALNDDAGSDRSRRADL